MIFPSSVTVVSSPSMDLLDFSDLDFRFSAFSSKTPFSALVVAILAIAINMGSASQGERCWNNQNMQEAKTLLNATSVVCQDQRSVERRDCADTCTHAKSMMTAIGSPSAGSRNHMDMRVASQGR